MVGRRKYEDGCAIAHGLDLVGERWALLIVRELLLGPKRFTDLRAGLPGDSADMLTQRLHELRDHGVVRHHRLAPPNGSWVYELTEWGTELEPVVTKLARWASRSTGLSPDAPIGIDSVVLSLRALFDAKAAEGFTENVGLRMDEQEFRVRVADNSIGLGRAAIDDCAVVFDTDAPSLSGLLRRQYTIKQAPNLRLVGDPSVARRFLGLFPPPATVIQK